MGFIVLAGPSCYLCHRLHTGEAGDQMIGCVRRIGLYFLVTESFIQHVFGRRLLGAWCVLGAGSEG